MKTNQQKIVLIGGPGTGKTTVLEKLKEEGFVCYQEISREITLKAQKEGIDQLFLKDPIFFSKMLLEGRKEQFESASNRNESLIFFDRGLPDITAYMDFLKVNYPSYFNESNNRYKYDIIFRFAPWKKIFVSDNERYENFQQSVELDNYLVKTYKGLGYNIINVPLDSVVQRIKFIKDFLK